MNVPAQSMFDAQIQGGEYVILPEGCALVRNSCFCGKWIGCRIYLPNPNPVALREQLELRYGTQHVEQLAQEGGE
jgi:hypothetical protein